MEFQVVEPALNTTHTISWNKPYSFQYFCGPKGEPSCCWIARVVEWALQGKFIMCMKRVEPVRMISPTLGVKATPAASTKNLEVCSSSFTKTKAMAHLLKRSLTDLDCLLPTRLFSPAYPWDRTDNHTHEEPHLCPPKQEAMTATME
ncbi:hypothetical protein E2C01_015284 [Portunus trituberculatus]|uniref:Uncharacterized protein n=1 Tax=Portunus trituberculatus TaxID=210409 RepID=A0A5B7DMJ9_PORTR|nr:hypothetical protein [Portunus trituberculatus]